MLRLGSAAIALPMLATRAKAETSPIALRILATTDLHCYLAAYDYYRDRPSDRVGLVRLATLIRSARADSTNTLLFDNGDLLQGSPLGDYIQREKGLAPGEIHPVYKAMNLLGYDAATLGNHDFDFGLDFLQRAIAGAAFPYVSANVQAADSGKPYFHPTVILDRQIKDSAGNAHALRVGVIGLVTPQITIWDKGPLAGKVTTTDLVETAARLVPDLRRQGANLVVALCHSGFGHPPYETGAENAAAALSDITGIDVVIAGHAHRVFPDPSFAELPKFDEVRGTLNGVPASMAGFYGSHLGVIDLTLNRTEAGYTVIDARSAAWPLHKAVAAPDEAVAHAIAADHAATLDYIRRPVGRLDQPLDSYFALVAPSLLLGLLAEIQRWAADQARRDDPSFFAGVMDLPLLAAVAPFRDGGHGDADNYTAIPAGDIAICNVADLYLYPNVLEVVAIDGATLREWLEMSAAIFHRIDAGHGRPQALIDRSVPGFDFDVLYGVTYSIDVTQPPRYRHGGALVDPQARRIVDLSYQGKPVGDNDRFLVATNNYRAGGGGSFPGLDGTKSVYRSPAPMQELIVDWFRAKQSWPVVERPWRFAGLPAAATITFETSPDAAKAIPEGSGISYLETLDNGFAKFRLERV